jgi:hypothetical protein
MVVSLDNYGGIFAKINLAFIWWKLHTWSGCGRNDWCEEKNITLVTKNRRRLCP